MDGVHDMNFCSYGCIRGMQDLRKDNLCFWDKLKCKCLFIIGVNYFIYTFFFIETIVLRPVSFIYRVKQTFWLFFLLLSESLLIKSRRSISNFIKKCYGERLQIYISLAIHKDYKSIIVGPMYIYSKYVLRLAMQMYYMHCVFYRNYEQARKFCAN